MLLFAAHGAAGFGSNKALYEISIFIITFYLFELFNKSILILKNLLIIIEQPYG